MNMYFTKNNGKDQCTRAEWFAEYSIQPKYALPEYCGHFQHAQARYVDMGAVMDGLLQVMRIAIHASRDVELTSHTEQPYFVIRASGFVCLCASYELARPSGITSKSSRGELYNLLAEQFSEIYARQHTAALFAADYFCTE